jgi:GTP cyclohydrolase I
VTEERADTVDIDETLRDEDGISIADPQGAVARQQRIADLTRELLEALGEDADREGLLKTPQRVAKAWEKLTEGYRLDLTQVTNGALFAAESSQMVIVRDIEFSSLCEHHLLPFFGRAHIGYIPDRTIIGISKFARITDMFARRLQVQERLTGQIGAAVMGLLAPKGVGVVIEAQHMCMVMRGVEKQGAVTTTTTMLGAFREDSRTRQEFMDALMLRTLGR